MSDGVLYVEIMPSTKGIGKAVEKDASAAFKGAGREGDSFFSKVKTGVKRVGLGIAAVAGTVAAVAIKGGISRALNIEDAQAKLKGLGHDTKSVEAIMTDALASVKGTAFGLDTAATVAATAVAAGIKPGKELEKYLRLTADAATIAGVSMEEMGSILNKTTTAGKVYTQELNQLADRGLPIFQWLQEEYGVTAEELRKMVAAGKVDAETFRKVIEENIGGAALASGDTTRGAFRNMMAALSRLGVAFLGDGLGAAKTFFQEVTIIFDGLGERIGPWVSKIQDKLGGMFQIEGMGENFLAWLDETIDKIASGPIPQLLKALSPLLPVLAATAALIGSALGDAFRELGERLAPIIPLLAESLVNAVVKLAPPLTDLIVALLPLVPPLVELLNVLIPLVAWIVEQVIPAVAWFAELLAGLLGAFRSVADHLNGDTSFDQWARRMVATVGPLGDFIRMVFDAATALGIIVGKAKWAADQMYATLGGFLSAIGLFFRNTWSNIVGTVSTGVAKVIAYVSSLPGKIKSALTVLPGLLVSVGQQMIGGLIRGVKSMVSRAVQAVKDVGGQMLDGVKSFLGIHSPSRVFRDEVGKMVGLGLLEGVDDRAIRGRIDTAVSHMITVPAVAGGGGFPSQITLVDEDGSILTRARVIAGEAVGAAFAGASGAAVSSRLGVRTA